MPVPRPIDPPEKFWAVGMPATKAWSHKVESYYVGMSACGVFISGVPPTRQHLLLWLGHFPSCAGKTDRIEFAPWHPQPAPLRKLRSVRGLIMENAIAFDARFSLSRVKSPHYPRDFAASVELHGVSPLPARSGHRSIVPPGTRRRRKTSL
jgi:hypothetical protein